MEVSGDNGEGFALFRWRTLQLMKYVLPECREKLVNWPIFAEWPPEKLRRYMRRVSMMAYIVEPDADVRALIESYFMWGYSEQRAADDLLKRFASAKR